MAFMQTEIENRSAETEPSEAAAKADACHNGRLRFWEIDQAFTCPLIGTCLTFSEQQRVLKKTGCQVKRKTPFGIHEALVASSASRNQVSFRVDTLLERKFRGKAQDMAGLDAQELMRKWRAALESGDYPAMLWVVASRPGLPDEYRREVFGAVHMAMHSSAQTLAGLKQQLGSREKRITTLAKQLKEKRQGRRTFKKENERLLAEKAFLESRLAAVEQEKINLEASAAELADKASDAAHRTENQYLKVRVKALEAEDRSKERRLIALQKQNTALSDKLEQQQELNGQFKKEAEWMMERLSELNNCGGQCPARDLCSKRVLLVGGITRMAALYRQLVETNGGYFEHHDGYMKNGIKSLEGKLKRSDMVVCPVPCNSHAACRVVKNLGRKYCKPVFMLGSVSLSAVSQAIQGGLDGEVRWPDDGGESGAKFSRIEA